MDSDRVVGEAKKLGGKAESAVGSLVGDSRTEAEGRLGEAKGTVQNAYGQAKDAVRDYADQASDIAGDVYEQGRRYVEEGRRRLPPEAEAYYRDGRQAVSNQVQESPIAALLIAGAVGYVLALLVHGRQS